MELDKFLVAFGVKGQDVVLSTIDRIQKKKKAVSKKTTVDLAAGGTGKAGAVSGAAGSKKVNKDIADANKSIEKFSKGLKKSDDINKKLGQNSEKLGKEKEKVDKKDIAKKMGRSAKQGVSDVGGAAASQNSTAFVKSLPGLVAGAGAHVPFIGALFSAMGRIINVAVDAATGSLATAKATSAGTYSLRQRNAASNYYGGEVEFARGAGESKGSGQAKTGRYSPQERADLIASVSSAFGKIKKPLADVLSPMIQSGKYDTGALSRVASGNWASTGTDKGFFLQKIADQFSELPPSVAQKFQATLLKKYAGGEIQEATPEQAAVQARSAMWQTAEENQTIALDAAASTAKVSAKLVELNTELNKIQVSLVGMGAEVSNVAISMAKASGSILNSAGKAAAFIDKHSGKIGIK